MRAATTATQPTATQPTATQPTATSPRLRLGPRADRHPRPQAAGRWWGGGRGSDHPPRPPPTENSAYLCLCFFLTGGGQGTVLAVEVWVPSWKPNSAENGKPPLGQCSGTEIPTGWKCTILPWTFLV
jgi:hypothetical protein